MSTGGHAPLVHAGDDPQPVGLSLFERMATDPNASVEKIERLMALWERSEARKAEAAFNASMNAAQKDMRPVAEDAWNPQTKSHYASYEALDRALRPIYTAHGFALSFDTGEARRELEIRVLCYVTHTDGHSRSYKLDMPADGKGAKGGDVMTLTHASASGISYGQRYLLKMIFNVATGEGDDDGNAAGQPARAIEAPAGFADWWDDIQASAENGWPEFKAAWNASPEPMRKHVMAHNARGFETLKAKAVAVKKS